jgi:HrpA-like RNA helicase
MAKLFKDEDDGKRRVYLSTNVAESSITLPGLSAVVDTGFHKHLKASADGQGTMLEIERCTRANADQRAGRVGRMSAGICYRLYSEAQYKGTVLGF